MKKRLPFFMLLSVVLLSGANYAQYVVYASHEIYNPGDTVSVIFKNGPGNPSDWIGLYKLGDNPQNPIEYFYVNNTHTPGFPLANGRVTFTAVLSAEGSYWVGFFENNGYTLLGADTFKVSSGQSFISINKYEYEIGEAITVYFKNGPNNAKDWIGIYKNGDIPGTDLSTRWFYVNGTQTSTVGISEGNIGFNPGLNEAGNYWLGFFENDGHTVLDSVGLVVKSTTAVDDNRNDIKTFELKQNYPNPFNPNTIIKYNIPSSSFVEIKVYNSLGQEIVLLVNKEQNAGSYQLDFNASGYTSGIYFFQIKAENFIETKKMILLR
ncbi:MAG: T9SS C-terminal target domain-containing protein [Ignavibacteriales bacterium]|nr:MAG: T9SS C-terminal target domain-containing protein [Ignavibacteriales bacterium]